MTPKEKAKDLYLKMLKWQYESNKYIERNIINTTVKQCSLIAVDEILNALSYKASSNFEELKYYTEVKQEIENL